MESSTYFFKIIVKLIDSLSEEQYNKLSLIAQEKNMTPYGPGTYGSKKGRPPKKKNKKKGKKKK